MKTRELLESSSTEWKYAFIVGHFDPDKIGFLDLHSLHSDPDSLRSGSIQLPNTPRADQYLANSAQEMIKILIKYIDEHIYGDLGRTADLAEDWTALRSSFSTIKDPLLFIDTIVEKDMVAVWGTSTAMVINSRGDKAYSFPYL